MCPTASPRPRRLAWTLAALLCVAGCGKNQPASEDKPRDGETSGRDDLAEKRKQSADNLKRIWDAVADYHDSYNRFPSVRLGDNRIPPDLKRKAGDEGGKSGLSWRVTLFPYLGENDLYEQFRLDEPWDSEHNLKLLNRIPKVYAPTVPTKEKNVTFYRVFVGHGAVFGRGDGSLDVVTLTAVANINGTGNTLMASTWSQNARISSPTVGPPRRFRVARGRRSLASHSAIRRSYSACTAGGGFRLFAGQGPREWSCPDRVTTPCPLGLRRRREGVRIACGPSRQPGRLPGQRFRLSHRPTPGG